MEPPLCTNGSLGYQQTPLHITKYTITPTASLSPHPLQVHPHLDPTHNQFCLNYGDQLASFLMRLLFVYLLCWFASYFEYILIPKKVNKVNN